MNSRIFQLAVACGAVAFNTGCTDTPPMAPAPIPTFELTVSNITTGGDLDEDGYTITVDAEAPVRLAANGSHVFSLRAGEHRFQLDGIADNCTLGGPAKLTAKVDANQNAKIEFSLSCDATGIGIVVAATGEDYPLALRARIGDKAMLSIRPNEVRQATRLAEGTYLVTIEGIASNCRIESTNPVSVTVIRRTVVPVVVGITCTRSGRRLAFHTDTRLQDGSYSTSLVLSNPDGLDEVALTTPGHDASWSPDGSRIAYSTTECDYYVANSCRGGISIIDLSSGQITILAGGALGEEPAWSPDGRSIAFVSTRQGITREIEIHPMDGSQPLRLSVPNSFSYHPSWSPNSRQLVFGCSFPLPSGGPGGGSGREICVVNSDGGGFVRLTNDTSDDFDPAWSPDGSSIAFATNRFPGAIVTVAVMSPTGASIMPVTSGESPAWIPGGFTLVFQRYDGIFRVDRDGTNLAQMTTVGRFAPAWRP